MQKIPTDTENHIARVVPTSAKCHNLVWDGQIFKFFFLDCSCYKTLNQTFRNTWGRKYASIQTFLTSLVFLSTSHTFITQFILLSIGTKAARQKSFYQTCERKRMMMIMPCSCKSFIFFHLLTKLLSSALPVKSTRGETTVHIKETTIFGKYCHFLAMKLRLQTLTR